MLLRNAGEGLGWAALASEGLGWAALALALSGGLWVASAGLALARLAGGPALAGAAAPAWSVALLLAPPWAGIRAGGFGAPLGVAIRAGGFGAPRGGAGIQAGGYDARPGGEHRSRLGSEFSLAYGSCYRWDPYYGYYVNVCYSPYYASYYGYY